ncbi:MAG: methyl-accepting chemotaxis protein, partial [Halothiobacillaceae bacterium]
LNVITRAVSEINDMNTGIAAAAAQQSAATHDINDNIIHVTAAINELSTTAQQTTSDGGDLSQTAAMLQTLTKRFGHLNASNTSKNANTESVHDTELF